MRVRCAEGVKAHRTVATADKVIILVCLVFGLMRFQKGRA